VTIEKARKLTLSDLIRGLVIEAAEGLAASTAEQMNALAEAETLAILSVDAFARHYVSADQVEERLAALLAPLDASATWSRVCQSFVLTIRSDLGLELYSGEDFNANGLTDRAKSKIAEEIRRDIARLELAKLKALLEAGAPVIRAGSGSMEIKLEIAGHKQSDGDGLSILVRPADVTDCNRACGLATLRLDFSVT